jgi:glycosyltransferase involved in cell wall biosynthesis
LKDRHGLTPRLVVVGDGVDRAALAARATALGVESAISWLGWKSPGDVAGIVAAADLLCLPSHMEGVPNAALEAFACGRPVVGTRVGGIPEVITDDTGVLAEPRAPESLAEALRTALGRSWDADRIRAHASRFDWAENARQLQGILKKATTT